jgi:hypothetical protein
MNAFCPFFRGSCKGDECVMFRSEECVIVSFLEGIISGEEAEETYEESVRTEVPKWLKEKTPEEILVEVLDFRKKEFPEEKSRPWRLLDFFWKSKNISHHYSMPNEIQMKMEKVNYLLEKEDERLKRQRLEEEKKKLPSLVSECVDWAQASDLKTLLLRDVDTYIMEKDIDILNETKKSLWTLANTKLKSKR